MGAQGSGESTVPAPPEETQMGFHYGAAYPVGYPKAFLRAKLWGRGSSGRLLPERSEVLCRPVLTAPCRSTYWQTDSRLSH